MLYGLDRLDAFVVLTAFSSFVLFLVVHAVGFRYLRPQKVGKTLMYSFALGLLADVVLSVWLAVAPVNLVGNYPSETVVVGVTMSVLIYMTLVFNYMVWVFGMGEVAIRIRLLRELYLTLSKTMTLQEIYNEYNAEMILRMRLTRLVDSGHLRFDGDTYSIGRRSLFIQAHLMRMIKSLLRFP